jgi:hypothetical protein
LACLGFETGSRIPANIGKPRSSRAILNSMPPTLRWYLADGPTVEAHNLRVTPRSRVLEFRTASAAFVWQRPSSVLVQDADGTRRSLWIVDATRLAQIALLCGAMVLMLLSRRSHA